MNPDPQYTYIRGTGWVCSRPDRSESFDLLSGESAHLEFRVPLAGECYDACTLGSPYRRDDGTPNWLEWTYMYKLMRLENCIRQGGHELDGHELDIGFYDCVVTLVLD